jgi:azurin
MKSFKQIISEVAQPRDKGAHEEQAFKDQHTYEVKPHPVALDTQFTGDIQKPQAMRKADQKGDANYDKAYSKGIFEEEANLQEDPSQEIPMMEKQLDFISQAVSEIKDSLGNGDPKEWYQNKLTAAYEAVKTLHANLQTEALSGGQKELDADSDGDIDAKDLAALRARKKKKTNEELDEDMNKVHTVDIDHDGSKDANAKKHNITLKKTGDYSHDATGKKKDLHKYLAKHYDSHDDAKELHPELHEADKLSVKKAIGIATDKRYKGGNMSGAVKAMDKMKPGISDHPQVRAVLKRVNESLFELDEDMNKVHTVDIDHTGDHDSNAKKHNITLKKSKGTADSHSATGKKKDLQKYLAKHYDSHDDAKDIHPEVHETTMSATKKPVTMTGPDGKTRTVMKTTKVKNTDDHGQDKIKTNESIIQELEENIKFKVGMLRLKNGKSVVLKKQDSDLLTQMFKDLSPTNRRKLGAVAMKDEAGFKEILGFAREAL